MHDNDQCINLMYFVTDISGELVDLSVLSTPEDTIKVSVLTNVDGKSLVTTLQLPVNSLNECKT